jgi:hypothetical protein
LLDKRTDKEKIKSIKHGEIINFFSDSSSIGKDFLLRQYNLTGYAAASICPGAILQGSVGFDAYVFYYRNINRFILTFYILFFHIAVYQTMTH